MYKFTKFTSEGEKDYKIHYLSYSHLWLSLLETFQTLHFMLIAQFDLYVFVQSKTKEALEKCTELMGKAQRQSQSPV